MTRKSPSQIPSENVDPERIEKAIGEKLIGERIRALRLKKSMGLVELGKLTGLSASFLSQLETGRVVPTLRNLARIALVFKTDIAHFFPREESVPFRKLEKNGRITLTRRQNNATFVSESLRTLITDQRMVPCLAEFHPNGEACEFTPKVFAGTEFLYVLEGSLEVQAEARQELLEQGDVCWIDAITPRRYLCSGTLTAKAMIITDPVS